MFPKPLKNSNASWNEHAIWSSASVNMVCYSSMMDQSTECSHRHTEQITSEQAVAQGDQQWRDENG